MLSIFGSIKATILDTIQNVHMCVQIYFLFLVLKNLVLSRTLILLNI